MKVTRLRFAIIPYVAADVGVPDIGLAKTAGSASQNLAIDQLHPYVIVLAELVYEPVGDVRVLVVVDAGPVVMSHIVITHPLVNVVRPPARRLDDLQLVACGHRHIKRIHAGAKVEIQRQDAVVAHVAGAAEQDTLRPEFGVDKRPHVPRRFDPFFRDWSWLKRIAGSAFAGLT